MRKVAIVGAGSVGSTIAYSMLLDGCTSELVLIDEHENKVAGDALDLSHCMMFTSFISISSGSSFDLLAGAEIVVVAAGVAQKPGQTRTELLEQNAALFKEIIPKIVAVNNSCILLIVTNPLDVMTYLAWQYSGFDSCRVFGTGTVLDTARLRYLIGHKLGVTPGDVSAYVLGEHGDSSFVWWSNASIAGISLKKFTGYSVGFEQELEQKTKNAAYDIIEKKGTTCYAIASVVTRIVRSILFSQPRIFTVSSIIHNRLGLEDVALSLPTIIRKNGACEMIDVKLDSKESDALIASSHCIKENIHTALSH